MISLTDRLLAIQIEASVQQLNNQTDIFIVLGDIVRMGGNEKTLQKITEALIANRDFAQRIDKKLGDLVAKGPPNGI